MTDLQTEQELIEIIRCALHGEKSPAVSLSTELGHLAKRQKVFNLLYLGTGAERAKKKYKAFVTKSTAQQVYFEKLVEACEQSQTDLLPIKGICTKNRFSRPELRAMDDIDILCKPEQTKQVHEVFEKIGFDRFVEGRKHDSYTLQPFVAVEVHRVLMADNERLTAYYSDIWQRVERKPGYRYVYEMCLEDEYIFNIVHLASHFQNGGAGLRFFTDIYMYEQLEMKFGYVHEELEKNGLKQFYENAKRLAFYWFGTDKQRAAVAADEVLKKMEHYVLSGGLYGDISRKSDLNAAEGKGRSLRKAVFPNYQSMQSMFPWLKSPLLLPLAWTKRTAGMLRNRRSNIHLVWEDTTQGDKEKGKALEQFYQNCGLGWKE